MKTYEEAIQRAADTKYHDYIGGSFFPRADAGEVNMIAFVFNVDVDTVWNDVDTSFDAMRGRMNVKA